MTAECYGLSCISQVYDSQSAMVSKACLDTWQQTVMVSHAYHRYMTDYGQMETIKQSVVHITVLLQPAVLAAKQWSWHSNKQLGPLFNTKSTSISPLQMAAQHSLTIRNDFYSICFFHVCSELDESGIKQRRWCCRYSTRFSTWLQSENEGELLHEIAAGTADMDNICFSDLLPICSQGASDQADREGFGDGHLCIIILQGWYQKSSSQNVPMFILDLICCTLWRSKLYLNDKKECKDLLKITWNTV